MATRRKLSLTPDLVTKVHRAVPDPGFMPGREPMADQDYRQLADQLLADHMPDDDLWLFAYGSLIWKPACEVDGQRLAHLRGWRRSFCLRLTRFRGTPDFPGLMMALDQGGSCRGVVQRLPAAQKRSRLEEVLRREISVKPPTNRPRWVIVKVDGIAIRAVAFTADRTGPAYAEEISVDTTADILSRAVGHWGSGAEYLMQTVQHLEQLDIHDRYLWELQAAVAERIRNLA